MKYFITGVTHLPRLDQLPTGYAVRSTPITGQYLEDRPIVERLNPEDELYVLNSVTGDVQLYTFEKAGCGALGLVPTPPPASTSGGTPVGELGFSKRLVEIFEAGRRADGLPNAEILTLSDFARYTEADLLRFMGFGKAALRETKEVLSKHGGSLKPSTCHLSESINVLGLSARNASALRSVNIFTLGDLVEKTDKEIFEATMSRKATDQIVAKLALRGLCLSVKLR